MFLRLGSFMGEGLELGLASAENSIIAQAKSIVDGLKGEFSGLDSAMGSPVAVEDWARGFESKLRASVGQVNATIGGSGSGGHTTVINNNFYTESSARESDMVAASNRRQAALGLFGG